MNPQGSTDFAHQHVMEHLEDEIKSLEGVTRWGKPIRIGIVVIVFAALAGGVAWLVMSPPAVTHRPAYGASTATPMDVIEPLRTLPASPARLTWGPVAGRLQYVVRIYPKGEANPILEKMTTATSIELTAEEQAQLPRGNYTWKVATQSQKGTTIAECYGAFKVR